MNNSDMPVNVLLDKSGGVWNLRDGHPDAGYLEQPTESFSIGLTKREHFAGLAMQGILSNDTTMDWISKEGFSVAGQSLEMADALLKALEANNE